jgi:hypothetical protein
LATPGSGSGKSLTEQRIDVVAVL